LLLTGLAVAEVLDLLGARPMRPAAWSVYGGALIVVGASFIPLLQGLVGGAAHHGLARLDPLGILAWPLLGLAAAVAVALIAEMRRYAGPGTAVTRVALAVFTVAYVAVPMSFLFALRIYGGNRWGMAALVSVIFVVKMSDTGAYALGRIFGRHKMAPVLSPKKTIEGAIGGIATACLCAWLFFRWFVPMLVGPEAGPTAWWRCAVYGIVVAVAGMVGDLAESLLKRDAGRKDSSRWMPGLGGVLDVLDSLLLAAPAAYACWLTGLVGP